ncbi:MAG: biotin--[acetyl-CoA-carboxylase] ligase [Clostridia bacterium]|nr:MAG: biotin--[acetyl-CoA-carboxylase] ligase [Clostridia bacterium]
MPLPGSFPAFGGEGLQAAADSEGGTVVFSRLAGGILDILRSFRGEYLSGEEIARQMSVSRTAIWKHVRELRELGYGVSAGGKLGYRLDSIPDRLYPAEVRAGLGTQFIGRADIHYYREVTSTNEVARDLGEQGAPAGTVVVAEAQVQGRGRLRRSWWSPPEKGVWMSVLLRPELLPGEVFLLSFATAVAVARAIGRLLPLEAHIKWPNDILVGGKKVAGILLEVKAELDQVHYVVVGMGLNVNQEEADFPPELRSRATSLRQAAGQPVARVPLVREILAGLEDEYFGLARGEGERLWQEWRNLDITVGRPVEVVTSAGSCSGLAAGVTREGRLVLRLPGGEIQEFAAGDVTLAGSRWNPDIP